MMFKSVLKSRTLWLAFGQFIVGVATALGASDDSLKMVGVIAAGKSLVDVVLRFKTSTTLV